MSEKPKIEEIPIEFRVFDWMLDKMIYTGGICTAPGNIVVYEFGIPLQYIGVKDKDDVKIYRLDIIECTAGRGVIIWRPISCAFKIRWIYTILDDVESWLPFKGYKSKKVIGNALENPELLEVKEGWQK